jgi:hypothetical protein
MCSESEIWIHLQILFVDVTMFVKSFLCLVVYEPLYSLFISVDDDGPF